MGEVVGVEGWGGMAVCGWVKSRLGVAVLGAGGRVGVWGGGQGEGCAGTQVVRWGGEGGRESRQHIWVRKDWKRGGTVQRPDPIAGARGIGKFDF